MAKTLIQHLKISSLSYPFHKFQFFSSYPTRQILTYLNQCNKRTHFDQIHAKLITSNYIQNPFFGSKLLKLSTHFQDLNNTLLIFKGLNYPDTVCFNTVIKAFCYSYVPYNGVVLYFEMLKCRVFSNSFTYPPLIGCCAKMGCVSLGEMCYGQVIKHGLNGVLQIDNSLIHMYDCCGLVDVALKVFEGMVEKDLVSWNSIVDGFMRMGDVGGACRLFDEMPERNVVSWNVMMSGYLENNNPGCVLKLFREMVRRGLVGSATTMVNVLTACGRSARVKEGASLHGFLVRNLWDLSLIINTALIDMYNKCQKVNVARGIFDRLPEKNLVCWNSMILGHCLHGNPHDGLCLFEDMITGVKLDSGVELVLSDGSLILPNEITFVGVLCACTREGMLARGRNYFNQMVNLFRIKPNFAHFWCMANLLASNGLLHEALATVRNANEFVTDMSSQALVWAHLLGSCRFEGDTTLAEEITNLLILKEPQNMMCYALHLNIYAAAARWDAVAEVKAIMKKRVAGKLTGCSLVDLVDIVHNFRVGDGKQSEKEIVSMMDALAVRLMSNINPEQLSISKTECQVRVS